MVEDTWKACQTEWRWVVGGEGTQSGLLSILSQASEAGREVVQEVGRAEVGRTELGRAELGRVEVGKAEVGRPEVGRLEVGRAEVGSAEVGRAEVGRVEVDNAEVGNAEVDMDRGGTTGDVEGLVGGQYTVPKILNKYS